MRFARLRRALANRLAPPVQTRVEQLAATPEAKGVSMTALAEASASYGQPLQAFRSLPVAAPGVMPSGVAMDGQIPGYASQAAGAIMQWGLDSRFHEGMAFLGYPYLAELAQRSEYRKMVETIARDATRKWIELKGPDETRLKALKDALITHGVRAKFQHVSELDGYFGRGQIFVDVGERNLQTALVISKVAIGKGKLRGFTVVEPVWTYPGEYNSTKPLERDFYQPREWYVMGDIVNRSRLLTFIAREVPDMLKATYAFGGLSMSQMAKPYVDNWLRTRQSVSDLIHSFSTMVLKTDLSSLLAGGPATNVLARVAMANQFRDNRGMFVVDKETEELENIAAPLSNLDDLQSQAAEQMCTVSGIPRLLLLGLSPKGSGIGDAGDGEIQAYFGGITAYQERFFRPHLTTVIQIVQLDLWGEIDPKITFEFLPLMEMDVKELADIRKSDAEAITLYVNAGVVSPDEAREVVAEDEDGLFFGVDLSAPAPEAPDDEDVLNGPKEGAADEWNEGDHPRDDDGKFGSGGGGGGAARSGGGAGPTSAGLSFKQAVQMYKDIDDRVRETNAVLQAVPGMGTGAMGLTPAATKERPDYIAARKDLDSAVATQREFAQKFNAHFAKELKAARREHGPVWQRVILAQPDG